ncbi:uncharacterized protein LOC121387377 isoform X2 [Gigantopelta aegis]|uniref:uncharacterized protein LOC121387377 isoform X2 n=1 Tax=Gigantopelta aegis TaxID=1735272 RepID=UPI001B8880E3|nr:uncharacterized protein LOC121387377 isoform X2 [Gigantopelta aegis]
MVRVRSTNDDEVRGTSGWKKGKRLFKGPTWQRAHLPGKEPCRKLQSLPWDGLKTSLSHDETRSEAETGTRCKRRVKRKTGTGKRRDALENEDLGCA